jgi:pyruvate dehydrogenase E1 component alpha subunit
MPIRSLVSYAIDLVEVMDQEGRVDDALMPALSSEEMLSLYGHMVLTRQFDERMFKLQRQGRMGTFGRVAGQEAAQVGAAFALQPDDWLVPAFREMGALLLRGLPMEQMLQYWAGDERGAAFPRRLRTLPVAIPVGTHMLHAVGIAWAMKQAGEKVAVLTFFGEGATSEGDFHEAMNMAAVFKVPVVFFCQNNQYAISLPFSKQTASPTVAQKALAYGMFGVQVDGNDVFAVYRATKEALERARSGQEPTLIEALTYRVMDHTTSDDSRRYRTAEEVEPWRQRDPIERLGNYLRAKGLLDDAGAASAVEHADAEVAAAVATFETDGPSCREAVTWPDSTWWRPSIRPFSRRCNWTPQWSSWVRTWAATGESLG